jgi:MFS family permease
MRPHASLRMPPWAATLSPLLALAAAVASGSNMLAPSLSAIAGDLGVPPARRDYVLGGLTATMFWLVGAPLSLGAGFLTDAVSRKSLGVAVGLAAVAVHAGLAAVTTVPALLALRAAHGALFGTLQPLLLSVVGDVCAPHTRPAVASAVGLAIGGGTAVGQLVAGAMAARTGWRAPLALASGLCAASSLTLWRLGQEPPREGDGAGGDGKVEPTPAAAPVVAVGAQRRAAAGAATTTTTGAGVHKGRHRADSSDPAAALLTAAAAASDTAAASDGSEGLGLGGDATHSSYHAPFSLPAFSHSGAHDQGSDDSASQLGRSGVALTARRVPSSSPSGGAGAAGLHRARVSSAARATMLSRSRSMSPHHHHPPPRGGSTPQAVTTAPAAVAAATKPRLPWRRRAAAAWAVATGPTPAAALTDAWWRVRDAAAWAAGEASSVCAVRTNALVFAQSLPGTVPWGVISSFLPDFLATDKGFTTGQATLLILAFAVGAVVGGVAGGLLGSRVHRAHPAYVPLLFGALQAASAAPVIALLNMPPAVLGAGTLHHPPPKGSPQPWSAATVHALAVAAGVLASTTGPNLRAMLLNVNPPHARGAAVTLAYVGDSLAKGVAPALVGLAVASSRANRAAVFSAAASCWVLSGAIIASAARTVAADEAAAAVHAAAAPTQQPHGALPPLLVVQPPSVGGSDAAATLPAADASGHADAVAAPADVTTGGGVGTGAWRKLKTSPPPVTTARGMLLE